MTRRDEDRLAVERCLKGEPAAFEELLERYKNQVFSLILRLVQNFADAEDIAQDAFIKAFKNMAAYDPAYPFITWLFKIAHNSAIDFLRKKKPDVVSLNDEEHPIDIPEREPALDEVLELASEKSMIEGLLARIPPLYREALILRYKEGLDLKEIAQVLQLPEGTVKIRLFRARDLLKREHETFRARFP